MTAILVSVTSLVLAPIVIGLFYQKSSQPPVRREEKSLQQLTAEYQRWEQIGLVPFFVFSFAIAFLLWWALNQFSVYVGSKLGESVILLIPTPAIWALPALFLGLVLSALPLNYLSLILLGRQRHAEYQDYCKRKYGMDAKKLLGSMALVVAPVCLAFTVLIMNAYVRITESEIIVNEVFSLRERAYRFDDIAAFELTKSLKAPNGNIVHRSFYAVEFKDGYTYKFDRSVSEVDFPGQQAIVDYLREHSDAPVRLIDPYPQ